MTSMTAAVSGAQLWDAWTPSGTSFLWGQRTSRAGDPREIEDEGLLFLLGGVDGVLGRVGGEVVQGREGSGLDVCRHFVGVSVSPAKKKRLDGDNRGVCGTWGGRLGSAELLAVWGVLVSSKLTWEKKKYGEKKRGYGARKGSSSFKGFCNPWGGGTRQRLGGGRGATSGGDGGSGGAKNSRHLKK